MSAKSRLEQDRESIDRLLLATAERSTRYLEEIDSRPPATAYVARSPLSLPQESDGALAALDLFESRYGRDMPASNGPRFWGFVTGGTTPAAVIGDWLTSVYDLNLSNAGNSMAPDIEVEAISMLRQLFGLPDAFSGVFVTGATMANFAALAIAREWAACERGQSVAVNGLCGMAPIRVLGGEVHSSVLKSLAMLGLGRRCFQAVNTLPGTREAVDVEALQAALEEQDGEPCIVVANAGTVNTVDYDDLEAIAVLKQKFEFWLHVDAAFGGFAACSEKYRTLMNGIDTADSITFDAHKWLNTPYDAAMVFTRHRQLQAAVFQNSAAYLGEIAEPLDFVHLTPENSRRLRALPVWFSLMAYGRDGYRRIVERCCVLASELGRHVEESDRFELLAPVRMNVVCFTLAGNRSVEGVNAYLARLRDDGRVFLTPTIFDGVPAIRAAFSNWRTEAVDVEIAWQAMNDCLIGVTHRPI